jgi:hypothetical protein
VTADYFLLRGLPLTVSGCVNREQWKRIVCFIEENRVITEQFKAARFTRWMVNAFAFPKCVGTPEGVSWGSSRPS